MANEVKYNANEVKVVEILAGAPEGLTVAEINAATGLNLTAGHITSMLRKHVIVATGEKRKVTKPGTKKVFEYSFVTDEVLNKEDGKPFNYTDGEKAILAAVKNADGAFTLDDLAVMLNKDKVASGSISGLVKKGNIAKSADKVERPATVSSEVNIYVIDKGIPEGATIVA